ncbi:MAG: hypothetical protein IJ375_07075 [Oscillospiraceae bacterium]|nr:hypothetical protein [Oscillospiraceae bacterium]
MNKRKLLAGCAAVLLAAAVFTAGSWFLRSYSGRQATPAEVQAHRAYFVDWTHIPGWQTGMTEQDMILSLCQRDREEDGTVFYTSGTLEEHLYRCAGVTDIYLQDEILYVYYETEEGRAALRYSDGQPTALAVYDEATDVLYQQDGEGTAVIADYYRSLRRRAGDR